MDIIEFYKGILESVGLITDERGNIQASDITGYIPYTIKGTNKRLVLPTQEVLRNPDWENTMAFHPLSENIARKDSVVFRNLQRLSSLQVNIEVGLLMRQMVEYCADKDQHKNLNHKQAVILSIFPDADEISLKNWMKIDDKLGKDHSYVKMVTLRNKELKGLTYPRVTTVRFPIYEEMVEQTKDKQKEYHLFGVKIRKKDIQGFKKLFEFIFSHLDTPDEHYSYGTRSQVAPSFHSLMTSFHRLKTELLVKLRLLKLDSVDVAWGAALEDLSKYKGLIPPLEGNEGDVTEGERRRGELTVQPTTPTTNKLNILDSNTPVATQPQVVPVAHPVPTQMPVQVAQAAPVVPVQPQVVAPQPVQQVPAAPQQQATAPASGNVVVTSTGRQIQVLEPTQPAMPQFQQPMQPMQPMMYPGQQPMMQYNGWPAPQQMMPQPMQQLPQLVQNPNDVPRMVDAMGKALPAVNQQLVAVSVGQPQGYALPNMAMPGYPMQMMPGTRFTI